MSLFAKVAKENYFESCARHREENRPPLFKLFASCRVAGLENSRENPPEERGNVRVYESPGKGGREN